MYSKTWRISRGVLLLGIVMLVVTACLADIASGLGEAVLDKVFEPGPTKIEAGVSASEDVNPDFEGKASPIEVRFYELKSESPFNEASFWALYENDTEQLGGDVRDFDRKQLRPGEDFEFERDLQQGSRFVGVIAAYQDIDNATWRAIADLEEEGTTELNIKLERLSISIEKD